MKKLYEWMVEILPPIWGVLWMCILTGASLAGVIVVIKCILMALGVL